LGSPVFFSSATPNIKALIDRAGYLGIAQGRPFERKWVEQLLQAEGQAITLLLQNFFSFSLPRNDCAGVDLLECWLCRDVGEVLNDEEGMRTIREFAKNVSWLIKKLR